MPAFSRPRQAHDADKVIRELLEPLGWTGGKTILDDYLREVRPFFQTVRTTQRTIYRPGEICQFDVWEPTREIPVGHGQTRKGYVVVACLGYSRAGAGALIFSKQTADLLAGIRRCLWKLGGLAETLVWDRQAGIHAYEGRPTQEFAAFCGQLGVGWDFCGKRDPQAKGVVERWQGYAETTSSPVACSPTSSTSRTSSTLEREGQRAPAPHDPGPADRPAGRGA